MHSLNGNACPYWRTPALLVYECGPTEPTKATVLIREPFKCRPSLERERQRQWRKNELPSSYTADRPRRSEPDRWKWKSRWYLSLGSKTFAEPLVREQTLRYWLMREDNGFSSRAQLTHNREMHALNGNIMFLIWLLVAWSVAADPARPPSDMEIADVIMDLMKENEQLRQRLASGRFSQLDLSEIKDRVVSAVSTAAKPVLQGLFDWIHSAGQDSSLRPIIVAHGKHLVDKAMRFVESSKEAYARAAAGVAESKTYLRAREMVTTLIDRVVARVTELGNRLAEFARLRGHGALDVLCKGQFRHRLPGLCPARQPSSASEPEWPTPLTVVPLVSFNNSTLGTCPAVGRPSHGAAERP